MTQVQRKREDKKRDESMKMWNFPFIRLKNVTAQIFCRCAFAVISLKSYKGTIESFHLQMQHFDTYEQLYRADLLKAPVCVCVSQIISTHVIRLKRGPDLIPLCVPPPSYDPNPQV